MEQQIIVALIHVAEVREAVRYVASQTIAKMVDEILGKVVFIRCREKNNVRFVYLLHIYPATMPCIIGYDVLETTLLDELFGAVQRLVNLLFSETFIL